ncbi:hypothetical protein F4818DRAFT_440070 [Hypoxylon cercidicola]|nr:hypothetical protein F4818DRAFT_440070 [Hypoxylon cercidicola]
MVFVKSLLALASRFSPAAASPLLTHRNETGLLLLENLAVRPNSDLLMTKLATLKRPYSPHPEASLVHAFAGASGLSDITETSPDASVVLGAEYESVGEPVPGTFAVWEVSFRDDSPSVCKITDFLEAQLANGALPIGINGLKTHGGYAYWSNSTQAAIYRTEIDGHGYLAAATNGTATPIEIVETMDSPFVDDFALDARELLWAATNADSKVDVVCADESVETVVGGADEDALGGDSAVAFGRTPLDRNVLYVTTNGTLTNNRMEPAKVVAVNRAGFY